MTESTRRDVLRTAAAGIAGCAAVGPQTVNAHTPYSAGGQWDHEYTFGHTMLFMEEYHQGTMEIVRCQSGELEQIGELTSRAAGIIKNGGSVWTSMNSGHLPHYELKEDRRGNPGILREHGRDFSQLKKGDMVFTNHCNKDVLAARERGVYVVCVTINYHHNEFRPAGFTANDNLHNNPDGLLLKDVSNEILHSHVPYYQGLVHAPEIPQFAICPSSGTGSGCIHWMLSAEIANKLANPEAKAVDKSAEYLGIVTERIERVRTHMDQIRQTAVTMARRIRDGGRWFGRSIEFAGFQSEFNVASGVRVVNWTNETHTWEATLEKNVMLINAISPAYREEVKLALEKQVEGAFVIGVGPRSMDGVEPTGRLIDVADVGFDNFSPESGGVIQISGREESICPTSGIVGNVIQQMIIAQWADEMVRRGSVPYFLMGYFQNGGRAYNSLMAPFFEQQGF
ncbi:MAG: hypothetical protein MK110_01820 [Fuerstiella sp.]|nr:hypothetical protein [Fuerstiella sp.]